MTATLHGDDDPMTRRTWSSHDLVTAALLHRVSIVRCSMLIGLVVAVSTLLGPARYTSRAVLATPTAGLGSAGIGGFAAQLGLGAGMGGGSRPPAFYINFARSDAVMQSLVQQTYEYEDADTLCTCDLVGYLSGPGVPRDLGVELAATELREWVGATMSKEAGTVELAVTMEQPRLAQAVANRLLQNIDRFNLRERSERAKAERQFLEERLDSARAAQQEAEGELEGFLETNREFRNSPMLQVRFDRLSREARLRQELTASINSSYEKARLEESRNTDVLVLVASASLPVQRDARFLIVKTLAAALVGVALGLVAAWGLEAFRGPSLQPYPESVGRRVRSSTIGDLWRPWRLIGIRKPSAGAER